MEERNNSFDQNGAILRQNQSVNKSEMGESKIGNKRTPQDSVEQLENSIDPTR